MMTVYEARLKEIIEKPQYGVAHHKRIVQVSDIKAILEKIDRLEKKFGLRK